jgi:hypothetical protein
MKGVDQFAIGVVTICVIIMRGVGVIDDMFSAMMRFCGLYDPHWQLYVLVIFLAFYVVLSLRAVGGMLGWAMLFFAVLILLHRTMPSLTAADTTVAPALQNAL